MKENTMLAEMLINKIEEFASSSMELAKLKLIRKFADVVSFIATQMLNALLLLFFFLFANIGLALWLGSLTGELFYGFLLVAGFYLLLYIVVGVFFKGGFRKYIKKTLINYLII
jgi:hypothetical protein